MSSQFKEIVVDTDSFDAQDVTEDCRQLPLHVGLVGVPFGLQVCGDQFLEGVLARSERLALTFGRGLLRMIIHSK